MIFPHLEHDEKVQVNDKIRLSGHRSFVSQGSSAIKKMHLKPYEDIITSITGTAATDLINHPGHSLTPGDEVVFPTLTGGAGLTAGTTYYVISPVAPGVSYKVSATEGGAAVNFTTDITAGTASSPIDIFDDTVDDRYLDWSYSSWEMDIDSTNNKIDFEEGDDSFTAELTAGTYSTSELAAEIKIQMDAEGANTYTVTVSEDDEMTISANGNFSLAPGPGNILKQLGFADSTARSLENGTEFTGRRIRYLTRRLTLTVGDGSDTATSYGYLKLFSKDGDNLFSNDSDLVQHEPDILKYLPDGKSSYKYAHRRSQELILKFLDEKGYTDIYKDKLLIDAIVDVDEVREWSIFLTLRLIYQGIKNATDDVFSEKVKDYHSEEKVARNRAILRLDIDGDGDVDSNSSEGFSVSTISAARR